MVQQLKLLLLVPASHRAQLQVLASMASCRCAWGSSGRWPESLGPVPTWGTWKTIATLWGKNQQMEDSLSVIGAFQIIFRK